LYIIRWLFSIIEDKLFIEQNSLLEVLVKMM
jgi:hypothetical protein